MQKNMGKIDRILRAIVGILIIAAGVYFQNWGGAIGLVLLFTATISWCPLYVPFKLSSRKNHSI